jgi:diguanylate cyclase (GGDEF)-like protein/PAS domain S-box-containing protein
MKVAQRKVLLVEDSENDARHMLNAFGSTARSPFRVRWVRSVRAALKYLSGTETAIVLLDVALPDDNGFDAFHRIQDAAPLASIVALCTAENEPAGHMAVQHGAQDYLIKGHVDARWLPRALLYLVERQEARDALRCSEARFRAMSDASPLGIFVSDPDGGCVYTNAAFRETAGLRSGQTLGRDWRRLIHPDDLPKVVGAWHHAARNRAPFSTEARILREDASVVWVRMNAAPMIDGGIFDGHIHTVEDITERKTTELILSTAEEALHAEKERAQVTLNSIGDGVLTTDLAGKVTYMNQVAEEMTGWQRNDALGRPLSEVFAIIDAKTRVPATNPAQRAMAEDRIVGLAANCVLIRRNGTESAIEDSAAPIHGREGQVTGAVIVFHDISKSQAMAMKMAHLAQHDFLTGLPNRVLLTERLLQTLGLAQRHHKQVALLFLDLDYFKHINDSLGHAVGDLLLQTIATRLVSCVRTTDTVCRQGGDEFVILLAEIEHPQDAAHVAEKLLEAVSRPLEIEGHELHISLSIGISIYPDDGVDVEVLMQNADAAMYHAKANGRDNYQFFRKEMNTQAAIRLGIETGLRRALKNDEFLLHYQPKVDLSSGELTGAEALIRWKDPESGLVYPERFIPIAEESGLIVPIGRWVMRETCRQICAWHKAGLVTLPVAVNVSAMEFRHPRFLEGVAAILAEYGLAADHLQLELTESIFMDRAESSVSALQALRAMGVRVAIDDFGTGFSSLSYLRHFPTDILKVDRSFVRDLINETGDGAIVSAVIGMGRSLKHKVIAEGVETAGQLEFLRNRSCDEGQGFLFSHPLPADEFARLLANRHGPQQPHRWATGTV